MDIAQIIERNPDAFNGDTFALWQSAGFAGYWGCTTAIETGTHTGKTSLALADICDTVFTIELNVTYHGQAVKSFRVTDNINAILDDSAKALPGIIRSCEGRIFFFLDSHWQKHCPLLEELDAIADNVKISPVIMIHDFYNPNFPEFGYDTWDCGRLDFELVKSRLEKIYGVDGFEYQYNQCAVGAKRGIIYIIPKV